MYTVTMDDLILVVKQDTWEMKLRLADATSFGQRITNSKLLSKALPEIWAHMASQGITREEVEEVEARIFEVINEHPRQLL